MTYILPIIILAGIVLGWRVHTIVTYFRKNSDQKNSIGHPITDILLHQ